LGQQTKKEIEMVRMIRNKKLVLKIVANAWENASRDERELSVVRELGADVLVMAKGDKTSVRENVKDFPVYRMSTRPLGKRVPKGFNRIASIFTWAYQARKFQPDVISGHDLIPLFIGWLSSCFQKKENRPKLVYDSHEFTIFNSKKSRFQIFLVTQFERFLIKRCAFTIEVNDGIADEVQRIHKLKERPVVVRNIPEKWVIDPAVCQETRSQIMKSFQGENSFFLVMYHGRVMPDRGIEMLIRLVSVNPNVAAIIFGNGEAQFVRKLQQKVQELSVDGRIYFHEEVPQKELWKYVGAADVGMILAPAITRNHLYSLPNKFFENIQSETPIVCPSYPEMERIIKHYRNGLTCDPTDLAAVNHCIEQFRTDSELYQNCKRNTVRAKEELCWEKEKITLKEAYEKLLG